MEKFTPDIEEMKKLVKEKSKQILFELTEDNLDYFIKEASNIAEAIMERYIYAIYDLYTIGDFALKNNETMKSFTNFETGYQRKMLEWKNQNKPEIKTTDNGNYWYIATLGVGTAGAIGLAVYCNRKGLAVDRCCLIGIAVELLTLMISYYLYLKENKVKNKHDKQHEQFETRLIKKKEDFVNDVINQLENWLKQGEKYSNKLLTKYNK